MDEQRHQLYLNRFVRADSNPSTSKDRSGETLSGLDARKFYEDLVHEENEFLRATKPTDGTQKQGKEFRRKKKQKPSTCSDRTAAARPTYIFEVENSEVERLKNQRAQQRNETVKNNLFRAITEGNIEKVKRLLSSEDEVLGLDICDQHGWTPLMSATAAGNIEIVKYLIDQGADIYQRRDKGGQSAWNIAVKLDQTETIDLFYNRRVKQEQVSTDEEAESVCHIDIDGTEHQRCELCGIEMPSFEMKTHQTSMTHLFQLYKEKNSQTSYQIAESNVGYKMLKEAGWSEEKGLGPEGLGQKHPIATVFKNDRLGLGQKSKERKRVTHFKAHDYDAIKNKNLLTNERKQKNSLKRENMKKKMKSKCWERNLRAYMNKD
eukprot:Seg3478.3 transcript_id=Seg3478.3/GoldUCD/mRNA.D3Y31 product="G patch domain and ankyrin repeat-containing protein 1-like" protein_id=Seg3478.3/GoldUCD/D3Y31